MTILVCPLEIPWRPPLEIFPGDGSVHLPSSLYRRFRISFQAMPLSSLAIPAKCATLLQIFKRSMHVNTRANIPCDSKWGEKQQFLMKEVDPFHSVLFSSHNTQFLRLIICKWAFICCQLGFCFVFFLLKTKYSFLCLRDLNSIHLGSESAVSPDRAAPHI